MRIALGIPIPIREIADALRIKVSTTKNAVISHLTTDTREAKDGDLFVALRGKAESGEAYILDAKSRGTYTLASCSTADLICDDTESSLLRLAGHYKTRLKALKFTVAITGSVGKTTTKDFCTAVLKSKYRVHSTYRNYNNAIGASLSLLSAPEFTEALVLELGMNHFGEIKALSEALKPTHAIITNIGNAHIGNFGSREAIARAKLEILCGMDSELLFVPYEEELLRDKTKLTFSFLSKEASFFMEYKDDKIHIPNTVTFAAPKEVWRPGAKNALCASFALAAKLGFEAADYIRSRGFLQAVEHRQKIIRIGKFKIIDDTYSSSPESVYENLKYMQAISNGNAVSAVLGDMLELGDEAKSFHASIGRFAAECDCRILYLFGEYADFTREGALSLGMQKENIFVNRELSLPRITAEQIYEHANENELILIKASHAISAERIIHELKELEKENAR